MGKHAQYLKRSSSKGLGQLPAPTLADFSIGSPTTTTIPTTRIAAIPPNATNMLWTAINNSTNLGIPATGVLSGLAPLTPYRVLAAWYRGSTQVSDWSPATLVSTI